MTALLRLLQTSDSAFPSGSFAFSNGLETLVAEGLADSPARIAEVLDTQVVPRWFEFDRVVLGQAWAAADLDALAGVDRDCEVRQTVAPLAAASRRIGRALMTSHARIGTPGVADYLAMGAPGHAAVAQGLIARRLGIGQAEAEAGALHALITGYAAAAIRLGRIGAIAAQQMLARAIDACGDGLARPAPALPASFAPLIDIAATRRGPGAALFAT